MGRAKLLKVQLMKLVPVPIGLVLVTDPEAVFKKMPLFPKATEVMLASL